MIERFKRLLAADIEKPPLTLDTRAVIAQIFYSNLLWSGLKTLTTFATADKDDLLTVGGRVEDSDGRVWNVAFNVVDKNLQIDEYLKCKS